MDRTTIMLTPELKIRIGHRAKKLKISMGQYIRDVLTKSLDNEDSPEKSEDLLYQDNEVFEGKTPDNLVSEHDAFLYGEV